MDESIIAVIESLVKDNAELQTRLAKIESVLTQVCKRIGLDKEYDTWTKLQQFDPKQRTLIPRDQKRIV